MRLLPLSLMLSLTTRNRMMTIALSTPRHPPPTSHALFRQSSSPLLSPFQRTGLVRCFARNPGSTGHDAKATLLNNLENGYTTTASLPNTPTSTREWNLSGLRKECERLVFRQLKKVGKAEQRHTKALTRDNNDANDSSSATQLLQLDVKATQQRLDALTQLEADLAALGKRGKVRLTDLHNYLVPVFCLEWQATATTKPHPASLLPTLSLFFKVDAALEARLLELEVGDAPPMRQPQGPKKKKGPRTTAPRKPYRTYTSEDGGAWEMSGRNSFLCGHNRTHTTH